MEKKICSLCKKEKSLNSFHKDSRSKTGRAARCKLCAKAESKRWYETSERYREIVRDSGLRNRYGIDSDTYWQMSEDQNNVCAICKERPVKYLNVDHSHETGEIRGLLCKDCNLGLGYFKDNLNTLQNAIEYLDRNTPRN